MPLHDHFRPPLSRTDNPEGFHSFWVSAIAKHLNLKLPPRFKAQPQVHLGPNVEADILEYDLDPSAPPAAWSPGDEGGGVLVAAPPDTTVTVSRRLMARHAVEVIDSDRDRRVAAVVELVSRGNKDRRQKRAAFVGKAAGVLLTGRGLMVVDIVTTRRANLHDRLAALFGGGPVLGVPTYAAAYAPVPDDDTVRLDIWARPLAVGQPLPSLPLQVLALGRVQVDLDASYREACEWSRIPD